MNTLPEQALTRALHDLATAPEPPDLADRALAGGERLRGHRRALAAVAAVAAVGVIATPFLVRANAPANDPPGGAGALGSVESLPPCPIPPTLTPHGGDERKWPEPARIVLSHLPARDDYEASGYGTCQPADRLGKNADTWIQIGDGRGVPSLGIGMSNNEAAPPDNCAEFRESTPAPTDGPESECRVLSPADPLCIVYGEDDFKMIIAHYRDGRSVWLHFTMEFLNYVGATVETLKTVVTDPALLALLPPR